MSVNRQSVRRILQQYGLQADTYQIEALGNYGGFSGALIWKIVDPSGQRLCLRRWPVSHQAQRTEFVHHVFRQAIRQGFDQQLLPLPLQTMDGADYVKIGSSLFELTRWLPGDASYWSAPSAEKLDSAATTLAKFHQSCRSAPVSYRRSGLGGILKRLELIDDFNRVTVGRVRGELAGNQIDDSICELAEPIIWHFEKLNQKIESQLSGLREIDFQQQVCIKDIWHDHVLFSGDRVSGIVDFGAIGVDSIATDISRLFGSLFQNSQKDWQTAIEAYQSVRELLTEELELIEVYDRSTTMLAGMNWLKWIFVEKRKFECFVPIRKRMELLLNRMCDWI